MTDEELEKWTCGRVKEVRRIIASRTYSDCKQYLLELASYIVSFAADAGATDWPAELHLGDVNRQAHPAQPDVDGCERRAFTGEGDEMSDDKHSDFGKQLIANMKDFVRRAKRGESFKQSIVRRMTVKGKTVYTRETFTAPLKESNR